MEKIEKVRIRRPFDRVPYPLLWALLLDGLDLASNSIAVFLGFIFIPLGILPDAGVDIVQSVLSALIFETPLIPLLQLVDFALIPPYDLIPSNTLAILAAEHPGFFKLLRREPSSK